MSEGWIALHRGWRDNPVFRGEFSRADAWIWLVERACWKPTRYDIKGKTVTLQRGQLCASREQMAEAWEWSPSAVERFLTRLKTEQMIERETGQGKSVITVCNYAKYQDRAELTGQENEQPTGQRSDRDRTAKEQGNKGTIDVPNGTYSAKGKIARAIPADWKPVLTPAAQSMVDGWPPGHFDQVLAAFLDHAADKGRTSKDWQAAFRTWLTNENKWNRPHERSARQIDLRRASSRGERPNHCLDMLATAEAEIRAGENPQLGLEARPALRALG